MTTTSPLSVSLKSVAAESIAIPQGMTTTTPLSVSLEACEVASLRVTGPHRISLRFRDNYVADLDFAHYGDEGGPLRRALCDPEFFARVFLAYGILSWENGYDIAPETLRRYAHQGFVG